MTNRRFHHRTFIRAVTWTSIVAYGSSVATILTSQTQPQHSQVNANPSKDPSVRRRDQSSTCNINGVVFESGQNLGDAFVTRCGPATDFPCFCSPLDDPPVLCPYCSWADAEQELVCAKDSETVAVVNLNGIRQKCSCTVSFDGTTQELCLDDDTNNNDNHNNEDEEEENKDFCFIQIADGTFMRFEDGESLGEYIPTRCRGGAAEFPCHCNPALRDQVDCRYCTFLDYRDDLICARQAESVAYEKAPGEFVECACLNDLFTSCKPMAPTLTPVTSPTTATIQPTSSETGLSPTQQPTTNPAYEPITESPSPSPSVELSTSMPTSLSTQSPTTGTVPTLSTPPPTESTTPDKESLLEEDRPPLSEPILAGCLYLNETTGKVEFIDEGDTFGPNIHGPCTPHEDWPVICNPSIPNGGMEYKFCVFSMYEADVEQRTGNSTSSNYVVCARTEERVLVSREDGSAEECSCIYFNAEIGPSSSCSMVDVEIATPSFPGEALQEESFSPSFSPQPTNGGRDSSGSFRTISSSIWGVAFVVLTSLVGYTV